MRQVDSAEAASLLARMTAAEIYESVTNGGASDFAEVVAVLNRNKPWCLIGGLAVNCYVEPVYTVDVDLVVLTANLSHIERELGMLGFKVTRFELSTNAQRPGSKLNLQFRTDSRYQDFLKDATDRQVLGMDVPLASLEKIPAEKYGHGRTQDGVSASQRKTSSISFVLLNRIQKCAACFQQKS